MTLGELLKNARISKGLTLSKVAEHSEISIPYLSDLENGKALRPKIKILQKCAEYLCIDSDVLIISAEKIPPDVYWKIVRHPFLLKTIRDIEV